MRAMTKRRAPFESIANREEGPKKIARGRAAKSAPIASRSGTDDALAEADAYANTPLRMANVKQRI